MTEFNKPTQEKDWDALAEKQLASIKRAMKISSEAAAVRAAHKAMTEFNDTGWGYSVNQEIARMAQDREKLLNMDRNKIIEEVLQLIKELRPAIMPLEGMGRGKATHEWFDILVKNIEEMKK
jgi:hypothetical protein